MRHVYSLFLAALAGLGQLQAQVVTLTDGNGAVVNGETVSVSALLGSDVGQTLEIDLTTQNTSGSARTINVKRYEVSVPAGTHNYFCWYECYGSVVAGARPEWYSLDPLYMTDGQTTYGFHAYYEPYMIAGEATFRYVWYDVDDPTDTAYVDLHFSALEGVGIQEDQALLLGFSAFPNPAVGADVTLSYALVHAAPATQLAVYNVLGERKLVRAVTAAEGKLVLRSGELGGGVWFAVLEHNGRALATKRVVLVN